VRTASRTAWPIIAAIFTLAACNGSKSSAATTTATPSAATSVAVSSTTAVAASTTATPTTTVAPVTTIAVTSTSTTLAPDVEVKAQYLQFAEAYWACLRAPDNCDPAATTASVGPARAALTKTLQDLVSGGLFAGTDDPGYVVVESVKLTGPTTAIVSACWWDTGVLYGPPAEAGGPPLVVNNLRATSRYVATMQLEGGRWLESEEKRIERIGGENRCPAKA
jgi:hypothetical protein